jgi:hypothetical protein
LQGNNLHTHYRRHKKSEGEKIMLISTKRTHLIRAVALLVALLASLSLTCHANAQTICDYNDRGVQLLWNEANGIPPDVMPIPQGQWVPTMHSQMPILSAWHPADWNGTELTESWMLGIHISSPDNRAAYQQLQMYTDPGISSQDIVSWGITELLGNFMGQNEDWGVLCQQDSVQSFPIPQATTLVAVTNGQTIVMASASVYAEPDMPQGMGSFTAAAGPVDQFTTLTEQVFLPLLYINKGGYAERGIDPDGDGFDNCTDQAPYDPNRH